MRKNGSHMNEVLDSISLSAFFGMRKSFCRTVSVETNNEFITKIWWVENRGWILNRLQHQYQQQELFLKKNIRSELEETVTIVTSVISILKSKKYIHLEDRRSPFRGEWVLEGIKICISMHVNIMLCQLC